jgi:hypothetical protein
MIEKILFRAPRCFCTFKGLYCLDLRLGVKDLFMHKKHSLRALNIKITIIFRARRCFCAFKGLYCLDLRLGVKDLFMHKKHSLRALNIKITILHIVMKVALFYTQNRSERSTFLHDGDDFFL